MFCFLFVHLTFPDIALLMTMMMMMRTASVCDVALCFLLHFTETEGREKDAEGECDAIDVS